LSKFLQESKKIIYGTEHLLKMFPDKIWVVMQERTHKKDSRCWWVARMAQL